MTVREASAYLKATPNTITIWCRAGRIPAIKIGRQWRISRRELDLMLTSRINDLRRNPASGFDVGQDQPE